MASVPISKEQPRSSLSKSIPREEWIKFSNWLLIWVVIANAGFAALWLIGAPPRWIDIILIGAIGLLVRQGPWWLQIAAFGCAMAYALLSFIAGLFNLSMASLLYSLQFFAELNLAQSIEYIAATIGIVLLGAVAGLALRRPQDFRHRRLVLVALSLLVLLGRFDAWMGQGMRGHYRREAVAGAPFTSAMSLSGVNGLASSKPRHLMVVVVESMGLPVGNKEMERLLFARYRQADVTSRYELKTGTSIYYNSTTAGEVRELCGRWGDYYDLLERKDENCLPARLRAQGFETSAYHSFTGELFERVKWYPNIGFENRIFAEKLLSAGLAECGGVFPGVCDREVPHVLARKLKEAKDPQFIYWLTVNSHLPVPSGLNLEVDHCERISPKLAAEFPMICRQFAIWRDIDTALVREITAPDFPPTDILIVGDHMPPYVDRHHRSQFAPDRVPWLLLRWKDGAVQTSRIAAARATAEQG